VHTASSSALGSPDGEYSVRFVRIGWPIGVTLGVETSLFTITAFLMGTLGTVPLAAHQIALQCAAFTFMVPLGIGIATSVRVGAARRTTRCYRRETCRTGAGMLLSLDGAMSVAAIAFLTIPDLIVRLYLEPTTPDSMAVMSTTGDTAAGDRRSIPALRRSPGLCRRRLAWPERHARANDHRDDGLPCRSDSERDTWQVSSSDSVLPVSGGASYSDCLPRQHSSVGDSWRSHARLKRVGRCSTRVQRCS
jgi:hypothetical protein